MYLSGRPLHALVVRLASRLVDAIDDELSLSFAGGADAFNVVDLLAAGLLAESEAPKDADIDDERQRNQRRVRLLTEKEEKARFLIPMNVQKPSTRRLRSRAGFTLIESLLAVATLGIMAAAYAALYLFGETHLIVYLLIAFVGVGWASIVSLPFAIVSQKVESDQMGVYMGLFNLAVVLPQLTVSLGVALAISRAADKDAIFLISAIAVALSGLAWTRVSENDADETEPALLRGSR